MIDEHLEEQINQHRATAGELGKAALEAISRGDAGMARSAARQAAQWARVVMQLESGEKQMEPDEVGTAQPRASDSDKMTL